MDMDAQRKAAGERAAGFVQDGMVIGFGTGRGAAAALEALAARKARVRGVPTSQKTVELCRRLGLAIVSFDDHPQLDLMIDGADGLMLCMRTGSQGTVTGELEVEFLPADAVAVRESERANSEAPPASEGKVR